MIDLKNLSNNEIIEMQYNLLEELKRKPKENDWSASFKKISKQSAEEFIKKRFADKDGKYETDEQYVCRIKWFEFGCPKLNKFSSKIGYKSYKTIRNYSSQFGWKSIRTKAIEMGYNPNKPYNFIDNTKMTVERKSKEYHRFKESVLKRDGVCQCCGSNENLEVHHLFSFKQYNSLGADTKNGIALCKKCHTRYHSQYGTKKNNNPVTLALFLRDYGLNPQIDLIDVKE